MKSSIAVLGLILLLSGSWAEAQQRSAGPVSVHIQAQPMQQALDEFARQTGLQLVFATEEVARGMTAPAVSGSYAPKVALDILLADSGLQYEFINAKTVAIEAVKRGERMPAAGVGNGTEGVRVAQARATSTAEDGSERTQGSQESTAGDSEGKLEEIIVTAQKKEERLKEVPVSMTVVDSDILVNTNQLRLQDYAARIPGLTLTPGNPGQQTITIRGLSVGGGNPTVAVGVDDVPFGSNTVAGGGFYVPDLDPGDLARVEVLRGPQGTLYGASSLGGLVKYVTRDPSITGYSGRLSFGSTSVNNGDGLGYNVRGSVNVPVSDTLALGLSGFSRREPGYIDNDALGIEGVNEQRVNGGRVSVLWRPSTDWTLKVSALFQHHIQDGGTDAVPEIGEFQQNHPGGTQVFDQEFQAYSATLSGKLGSAALTSISAYNRSKNDISLDFPGFAFYLGSEAAAAFDNTKVGRFTQEIRLAAPIASRIDAVVGVFYTNERTPDLIQVLGVDPSSGARIDNGYYYILSSVIKYNEYAAFTNLTFQITDRFDVQVGGRESRIQQAFSQRQEQTIFLPGSLGAPAINVAPGSSENTSAFTYLLTPRYKLTEDLMIYSRMASGYRTGGLNDAATCRAYSQPCKYDPDESQNYELGIKADFWDHALFLDAAIYRIDWKNIQLTVNPNEDPIPYTGNGGRARSEGVELSMEARPLHGLSLAGWVAWNDAKLMETSSLGERGDRLPLAPEWSGRLSITQELQVTSRLSGFVEASANYVGDRGSFTGAQEAFLQTFPAYTKFDASAGVQLGDWAANLFVTNVTDERGTTLGNPQIGSVIYIQPRTIGLSLSRNW